MQAQQPYDPVGAMGGLFAPAYIVGNPQSEQAVGAWNTAHLQTPPAPDVQPTAPVAPTPSPLTSPAALATGLPQSTLANTRFAALGTPYPNQRRDTIAAAMMGQGG